MNGRIPVVGPDVDERRVVQRIFDEEVKRVAGQYCDAAVCCLTRGQKLATVIAQDVVIGEVHLAVVLDVLVELPIELCEHLETFLGCYYRNLIGKIVAAGVLRGRRRKYLRIADNAAGCFAVRVGKTDGACYGCRFTVCAEEGALAGAGRTGTGQEGRPALVTIAVETAVQPWEARSSDTILLVVRCVDVEAALVELRTGSKVEVPGVDRGVRQTTGDLEAFETLARDDVCHTSNSLRAVGSGGAVRQNVDTLDHGQRILVEVDEVRAASIGDRGDTGAFAVQQSQGRAETEVANVELDDALAVVGLVVELRATVGR